MRVAIYYTPPPSHPLAIAGARWLGRDAFEAAAGEAAGAAAISRRGDLADITAEPRRYGFHATVKAPFRLREGRTPDELAAALGKFCADRHAPDLGPLRIADLGDFIALVPDEPRPALAELAADAVRAFELFRAPLTRAELERRLAARLTPRQEQHVRRWGYPYVCEDFRFHMTLTGRVPEDRRAAVTTLLQERFNGLLRSAPAADCLALFVEPEDGADFVVQQLIRLGTGQSRDV